MIVPRKIPPPPSLLARLWEAGELSREEFHQGMAVHAEMIIEEMEEVRGNPIASFLETLTNKNAARKLKALYKEAELREVMVALSEIPDFPPAIYLWNASHDSMPLHCFIRSRWEPILRFPEIEFQGRMKVIVRIDYGSSRRSRMNRERIVLRLNPVGVLVAESREQV